MPPPADGCDVRQCNWPHLRPAPNALPTESSTSRNAISAISAISAPLQRGQRLVLAAVNGLHAGAVGVHAPATQGHDGLRGLAPQLLQQIRRLSQLCAQRLA